MESINTRVKALRESLNMSQECFGNKIGLSKSGISSIENGTRNVTEKHIKIMTFELDVNEHWLRTGDGEMFISKDPKDLLPYAMGKILAEDDEFMKNVILTFYKLSPQERDLVKNVMSSMLKKE